jgi:hypothetical protein
VWLSRHELHDDYDLHPRNALDVAGWWRLKALAFPMTLLLPNAWPSGPWAYVEPATSPWPFIERVHYGAMDNYACGGAGDRIYVTFFGYVRPIADWPHILW